MKRLSLAVICALLATSQLNASEWQSTTGGKHKLHFRDAPENYDVYAQYGSSGRIVGKMQVGGCAGCSAVIDGIWAQQDSKVACPDLRDNSGHWGRVHLEFNAGYTEFTGTWDYCGGGDAHPWNGYRVY